MILRYTVEGKFSATFTAKKVVPNIDKAYQTVFSLKMLNQKEGYCKYSNFILYSDHNKVLERINF